MVSVEIVQVSEAKTTRSIIINEQPTSPRISFSAEFLDESNFISITPHHHHHHQDHQKDQEREKQQQQEKGGGGRKINAADFEFLSNTNDVSSHGMLSADELFFEGKLLPFWQIHQSVEKLNKISLKTKDCQEIEAEVEANVTDNNNNNHKKEAVASTEARINWFVDDDPSPRPPKCTVLWKELLRLKKQRASSSLSPSSSSSSTSSSSSSLADVASKEERKEGSSSSSSSSSGIIRDNKHVKRIKKGLERTRSASIRIRPMVNVPICSQVLKSSSSSSALLPPLFPLKKGRLER